jgi:hypothetical protein
MANKPPSVQEIGCTLLAALIHNMLRQTRSAEVFASFITVDDAGRIRVGMANVHAAGTIAAENTAAAIAADDTTASFGSDEFESRIIRHANDLKEKVLP